jgi:branched-chain amino acid transport system ATP-binding protein
MKNAHPFRQAPPHRPGDPLLALRDVAVAYEGIRAIQGVSLHVNPGEIVALIGANGAGKTTTLKSIMRLLPLSSGTIEFAGRRLDLLDTASVVDLGMCLVPEGRAIVPNLTVRENLELGAYNHKHAGAIRESIDDVVALFPRLGERMRQEGGTLSGGEQQMLAIGRAMMARPAILLLDEPSLGIAPRLVQDIFAAVAKIAASGTTILLVEQNTRLALRYSARAYVLRTGQVAKPGESRALADDPEIQELYLGG